MRQGFRREPIGAIVLFCGLADALLIAAGVGDVGAFLSAVPQLTTALALGGAAFPTWYRVKALRRTAAADAMVIKDAQEVTLGRALSETAAFTFLNPHVYLYTVLLMGTAGSSLPVDLRPIFVTGAATASFTWFAVLGFGVRRLRPVFVRSVAWRVLNAFVGVVMRALAVSLVGRALSAIP